MEKKIITEFGIYAGGYCKPPKRRVHDGLVKRPCVVDLTHDGIVWYGTDGNQQTLTEPTTILSKAIEQVEQMGNYKVMVALVDLNKGDKPKEERLYTFTDIESKKLREVIYKEMEKDF